MTGFRYDRPSESPGFLLWQVTNAWQRQIRAALASYDLTHVQFVLLAAILWVEREAGADEPPTQRSLAGFVGADEMMTSQVLRTLERKGMVERARHGADGRARALLLTEVGRERVTPALAAVEAADQEFFRRLGSSQRGFLAGLRKLRPDQ